MRKISAFLVAILCLSISCLLISCGKQTLTIELIDEMDMEACYVGVEYDFEPNIVKSKGVNYSLTAYYLNENFEKTDISVSGFKFTQHEERAVFITVFARKGGAETSLDYELSIEVDGDPLENELMATWADESFLRVLNAKRDYIKNDSASSLKISHFGNQKYVNGGTVLSVIGNRFNSFFSVDDWSNAVLTYWIFNPNEHDLTFTQRVVCEDLGLNYDWDEARTVVAKPNEWTRVAFSYRYLGITDDFLSKGRQNLDYLKVRYEGVPADGSEYSFSFYLDDYDITEYSAEEFPELDQRLPEERDDTPNPDDLPECEKGDLTNSRIDQLKSTLIDEKKQQGYIRQSDVVSENSESALKLFFNDNKGIEDYPRLVLKPYSGEYFKDFTDRQISIDVKFSNFYRWLGVDFVDEDGVRVSLGFDAVNDDWHTWEFLSTKITAVNPQINLQKIVTVEFVVNTKTNTGVSALYLDNFIVSDDIVIVDSLDGELVNSYMDPGFTAAVNFDESFIKEGNSSVKYQFSGTKQYYWGASIMALNEMAGGGGNLNGITDWSNAELSFWVYNPSDQAIEFGLHYEESSEPALQGGNIATAAANGWTKITLKYTAEPVEYNYVKVRCYSGDGSPTETPYTMTFYADGLEIKQAA